MEEKMIRRSCVDCAVTACERKDGKRPDFCLTTSLNPDLLQEAIACYEDMEDQKLAIAAAEVEYEGYLKLTRVEEIIAFSGKIEAKSSAASMHCALGMPRDFIPRSTAV